MNEPKKIIARGNCESIEGGLCSIAMRRMTPGSWSLFPNDWQVNLGEITHTPDRGYTTASKSSGDPGEDGARSCHPTSRELGDSAIIRTCCAGPAIAVGLTSSTYSRGVETSVYPTEPVWRGTITAVVLNMSGRIIIIIRHVGHFQDLPQGCHVVSLPQADN